MNKKIIFIAISISSILVIFWAFQFSFSPGDGPDSSPAGPSARIGGTEIPVEIARTNEERTKGLSGRISLEADKGMLFVFPEPGDYSFWMPNMNFPIDIIWIADDKVVGIENNVSNEFDPQNPEFFAPPWPVKHVLEVNAGFSEANGIGIGDGVIFRNTE